MTSKTKTNVKVIWKILKWLIIAIGGFLILVLVVNLDIFDEELNPEFVQLVESYKSVGKDIPDDQNGFFYLLAINGPADENLHALGKKMVNDYEQALQQMNQTFLRSWNDIYDIESTKLQGDADRICDFSTQGCLAGVAEDPTAVRSLLEANQQRLERYRRLHNYEYFMEKMTPSDYAPIPTPPITLHKLFLTGTALLVVENDIHEAFDNLYRDTIFWRKVLANATEGLTKMVAKALLQQNIMLLADIIHQTENMDELPKELINGMIKPLGDDELSMEPLLSAHAVRAFYLPDFNIGNCMSPAECVFGFLYQRNASMNYIYDAYKKYSEIMTLTAPEMAGLTPEEEQRYSFNARQPVWVYNIMGKLMLEPLVFGFTPYTFRIYNLEGFRRLVALQMAIKEAEVELDEVSEFVRTAGDEFNNPYTNAPMIFDEKAGTLYFKGMGKIGEPKDFTIRL